MPKLEDRCGGPCRARNSAALAAEDYLVLYRAVMGMQSFAKSQVLHLESMGLTAAMELAAALLNQALAAEKVLLDLPVDFGAPAQ